MSHQNFHFDEPKQMFCNAIKLLVKEILSINETLAFLPRY